MAEERAEHGVVERGMLDERHACKVRHPPLPGVLHLPGDPRDARLVGGRERMVRESREREQRGERDRYPTLLPTCRLRHAPATAKRRRRNARPCRAALRAANSVAPSPGTRARW